MPAIAVAALALAVALLVPGRPVYAVLYLLAALYLVLRVSVHHTGRNLQVTRELSEQRIFQGETLQVTLRLRNPTGIPIQWLYFWEARPSPMASAPLQQIVTLAAGAELAISYPLQGTVRGRYSVGPLRLTIGEPFGLIRYHGELAETQRFTVYPKISPLPKLGLPARLPLGDLTSPQRLFEDPAWLAGTREYAPGDSLRRIHWNATAKTGQLIVKQFRHAVLLPCCVAVNLNQADYAGHTAWSDSELAVTAAASLSAHLIERKLQLAFVATALDADSPRYAGPLRLPLRQGRAALTEVLEVLARAQLGRTDSFAAAVGEFAPQLPWGTLLCLITPQESPEIAALCTRLAHGGRQVLLFLVGQAVPGPRRGYRAYGLWRTRAGDAEVVG